MNKEYKFESLAYSLKLLLDFRNIAIAAVLIFSANYTFAAEGGPCKDYGDCDQFKYSLNDMDSLQSGASTFLNYCYGCHSLQYSRWGRIAKDLQIPEDIFFENLVFDKSIKAGDLMTGAMPKNDSAKWFGVAPPDLTLVSRVRGDDWLYSYLRTYYEDSSKQYGVNNLVYPGTAMPNVLAALQGNQKLVCKNIPVIAKNGGQKRDSEGNTITKENVDFLQLKKAQDHSLQKNLIRLFMTLLIFLYMSANHQKPLERELDGMLFFIS